MKASKLKFRVRQWPVDKYTKPPLATEEIFDTYDEARKVANKLGAQVEPHFLPQKVGKYDMNLTNFETGQNDVDITKLRTKKTKKK